MSQHANVVLAGGIYHEFDATSRALGELLSPHGIHTQIETDVEAGLARVRAERPALLTFNLLRWRMQLDRYDEFRDEWAFALSDEGKDTILEHLERGGGVLALHTASICFDDWDVWGDVLGAAWRWGESYHPTYGPVTVFPTQASHAITHGLPPFDVEDEVYSKLDLRPDVEGLLAAVPGDGAPAQPLLFARTCGRGRVVYDALGHDVASIREPTHARILVRSALWALGMDEADIEEI